MKEQVLSIEQMRKLAQLGVDINKASMCYVFFESDGSKYAEIVVHDESCYEMACMNPMPTFTLQDMIELMPKCIVSKRGHKYDLSLGYHYGHDYIEYRCLDNGLGINTQYSKGLLTGAFNMLLWVAENSYLTKRES